MPTFSVFDDLDYRIGLLDSSRLTFVFLISASDTLSVTDTSSNFIVYKLNLSDTLNLADVITVFSRGLLSESIADTETLSDAIALQVNFFLPVSDTLNLADVNDNLAGKNYEVSDSLVLVDGGIGLFAREFMAFGDILILVDVATKKVRNVTHPPIHQLKSGLRGTF